MHRKFIALIVSTAIAVTGVSLAARPARADDTAKILAGIAAIALIGAAINNSKSKVQVVTRPDPVYPPYPIHPHRHPGRPGPIVAKPTPPVSPVPRPLPPRFTRYDLPRHCVMQADGYQQGKVMVGSKCLEKYYGSTASLPRSCRVTFTTRDGLRTMFRTGCLEQHGYRMVRR